MHIPTPTSPPAPPRLGVWAEAGGARQKQKYCQGLRLLIPPKSRHRLPFRSPPAGGRRRVRFNHHTANVKPEPGAFGMHESRPLPADEFLVKSLLHPSANSIKKGPTIYNSQALILLKNARGGLTHRFWKGTSG